jgi:hypothetical protein
MEGSRSIIGERGKDGVLITGTKYRCLRLGCLASGVGMRTSFVYDKGELNLANYVPKAPICTDTRAGRGFSLTWR